MIQWNGHLYLKISNCSISEGTKIPQLPRLIDLERGCRQGDPISPYLFVLSAEILAKVMRECDEVGGLQVGGIETKLSQFADDNTLFLKGDVQRLRRVLNIFR